MSRTERIRQLNDQCRTSLSGCRVMITQGVAALDQTEVVLKAVREFSNFTADNDPYGEHDFGSFVIGDNQLFWKYDYYDVDMQMASLDPADDTITVRVLTIMLADEY
jgi:hypothetical protein